MTPTPPSTNSSNHGSPEEKYRVIRKRNRIPLSCAPCRQRKLKCNRSQPCDNCIKRGEIGMCSYASPAARKKSASGSPAASPDEMQNRIDRLENLVLSLMTNGSQSGGPAAAAEAIAQATQRPGSIDAASPDHRLSTDDTIFEDVDEDRPQGGDTDQDVANVAKSIGVMKVDNSSGKTMFISEAHWYSILAEISDFKTYFNEHKKVFDDRLKQFQERKELNQQTTPSIFLFNNPPATRAEVLRSFPPKVTTDVLISRFFDVYNVDAMFRIIHGPTYQKQYNGHWVAPLDTDVAWLGLSYSMMMIALISFKRCRDEPPEYKGRTDQMYRDFKRLCSQCLAHMDINHPSPYILETLIFYILSELANNRDSESTLLMIIATTVRLAMKMGYHRDSKYFPDISPFQGEMRRRVWTVILSSDLKFSAQAGLPPMIRADVCNTDLPRNLYDDELDVNMTVLPPSREIHESTPIAYIIYKGELIQVCYAIVEEVQRLRGTTYETIMQLDARLREVHDRIPPFMRLRSLETSVQTEQSSVVLKRYMLEILYLKYLCLVHRKYAGMPRAEYSTRTCISSAMDILEYQAILFDGMKPGGPLADSKIFVTSLATHDFLLAAMIVATHLYRVNEADRASGTGPPDKAEVERRAKMQSRIEQSLRIWDAAKDDSMEAFKAAGALSAMLRMLSDQEAKTRTFFAGGQNPTWKQIPMGVGINMGGGGNTAMSEDPSMMRPEHHAAMTLGMLSTDGNGQATGSNLFTMNSNSSNGSAPFDASAAAQHPATTTAEPLNPQSPFSTLFNTAGFARLPGYGRSGSTSASGGSDASSGWDLPNGVDWDAFDSYVNAGGAIDSNSMYVPMWPVNLDPAMDPNSATTQQNANMNASGKTPQQQTGNGYGNVFMGLDNAPRGSPSMNMY